MKVKKMLEKILILLPFITAAACSSNKYSSNEQSSETITDVNTNNVSHTNDEEISSSEEARLQIQQKLQKNNIVYFNLNKYDIHSEFTVMLDSHASFLRKNPSYKVIIEGHADERGTSEYNIALGERRANAVKMYLQGRGVSPEQISIVSYGKEKPAVLGHDEIAYSKNRRAIVIY